MNNDQRLIDIKEKLTHALQPSYLEVVDDSAQHIGHAGSRSGAGHFSVIIASDAFEGQSEVECHQLVYAALGDMMKQAIHALRIFIKR